MSYVPPEAPSVHVLRLMRIVTEGASPVNSPSGLAQRSACRLDEARGRLFDSPGIMGASPSA